MGVNKVKSSLQKKSGPGKSQGKKGKEADLVLAASDASKPFDGLVHERNRLAIVSALAVNKTLTFNDLKSLLGLSDGNLSAHARKLEDASYISCKKSFEGRVPRTDYTLTAKGRKALESYLSHMESLISTVKNA